MNKSTLTLGGVGLAGLVGVAMLTLPGSADASGDDPFVKRDDSATELVVVDDGDLDDLNDADHVAGMADDGDQTRTRTRGVRTAPAVSPDDLGDDLDDDVDDSDRADVTGDQTRDDDQTRDEVTSDDAGDDAGDDSHDSSGDSGDSRDDS